MLVRLRGWGDTDVLALLALFRKHLLYYVYASDGQFADVVRAELPEKASAEILEMVRSLMEQFGLRLSTKNFRTDVIVVTNRQEVYVYEHIYESIRLLPENKAGGVWLPDELSRFLQKAKKYRTEFTKSQEKYFQQIQLWGKSIAETKSKFYALRDVYMKEKRRPRQRVKVEATRLDLLKDIFIDVPPVRRAEKAPVLSKTPKLWSSEQMESLVDYLVRITIQIQTTGSSDLVDHVAEALHRTDGSCVNKLADMQSKFLQKSSTARAPNLPDSIFDPTSEAHKIFSADWKDNNDPYALGYLALKSRSLKLYSEINKKRRSKSIWAPRHLRSGSRRMVSSSTKTKDPSTQGTAQLATSVTVDSESRGNEEIAVSRKPPARTPPNSLPENDYSAFVRDIAVQCRWTEKVVHNVLRCMQHSIDLYRSNKLVDFYYKIAGLTPDVTFQDLFADGQFILTRFEQRFGTLDGFENLILTVPGINSPIVSTDQETKEDHAPDSEALATANAAAEKNASISRNSDEVVANGDEREHDQSPVGSLPLENSQTNNEEADVCGGNNGHEQSPVRTPQTGNEDTAMDGDEHEQEQSPLLESPARTPRTGNEDAVDEHSSSTAGKQSSPEDTWGDGADIDADLDDDGLDNHSVGSSDNAWSGSNVSNPKNNDHRAKVNSPLNNLYPLSGQYASGSSKKPSKRGKNEQYGKNFELAKKRRLNEKNATAINNDEDDDDEEEEDGGYEDENDDPSEDVDEEPMGDVDSMSSDGELEDTPHPLQCILDSLDSHLADLQEKQRLLIERKEDREWRQRQYAGREYGAQMSMQSFASER